MNWKSLLAYLKFIVGIGFGIFAYVTQIKYFEILIVISGLIILVSGVEINFNWSKDIKK